MRARMLGRKPKTPPFRTSFQAVNAHLIGIHAKDGGGRFSHRGKVTHIHVLVEDGHPLTGHVESAAVGEGAVLYLPSR